MTTRRRRPTRTHRGLTLEQLDDWFFALEPPARVEGVSMLDGYLTAIIIGPRSIPPEEWYDDLFGARGNIAVEHDAGGDSHPLSGPVSDSPSALSCANGPMGFQSAR
jgi:hypothetical protein